MVFLLRLISGLLLVSLYAEAATQITGINLDNSNRTTNDENTTKELLSNRYTTPPSNKLNFSITDEDVENIVKPFKFSKENDKIIHSVKLGRSEPYNSIRANRTQAGRAVDIDVYKFSAPVDHNAVYILPDNKELTKEDESLKFLQSTEEIESFENIALTTPKTPYFDQKYKEIVESIYKVSENIPDSDIENATLSNNHSSDNFIDTLDENTDDAKLEYKTFEAVTNSNQTDGRRKSESVKESRATLRYENKYNISTSYERNSPSEESNELHKETVKHFPNDVIVNEVKQNPSRTASTVKYNPPVTLKNSITITSTDRGDSAIISNKIEGDLTTTPSYTPSTIADKPNISRRGSIKFADYNKVTNSTASTPSGNKTPDQTVEENQVVPIHITSLDNDVTTNRITSPRIESDRITTVKTKSVVLKSNAASQDDHQSTTVYLFVQPEEIEGLTTIKNEIEEIQQTSVASTPRAFQPVSTTLKESETTIVSQTPEPITTVSDSDERTTAVTSIPRGFSLPTTPNYDATTENLHPTDGVGETTTFMPITTTAEITTEYFGLDFNSTEEKTTIVSSTSTRNYEVDEKTSVSAETSTVSETPNFSTTELQEQTTVLPETSTESEKTTTVTELRSSKNMKFLETTEAVTTEYYETTTHEAVTTFRPANSFETTSSFIGGVTTVKVEGITETTTSLPITTNEIPLSTSKEDTSELVTKLIVDTTPTKTLLENETTEEKSTQDMKTTPSTSFNFVHIENIDKNHTTLTPDELKPNEIYKTKEVSSVSPNDDVKTTTETPADETTSSGLDGPSSSSGTVVAIIISCVGGICLIALACLLIVMRNRQSRFNYGQRCRPVSLDDYSVDNVSVFNSVRRKAAIRGSKTSYGNPAFEDPVCLSHPLNFPAISKFANNQEDVTAEFQDIPQIVARTSELPEGCETKNRYANVIPLPESRVFLKNIDGYPNSDYINANFVTGPKNIRKYYIACQAPMSNTVDDFWRMIWEQQCKVILMLSHLFENGIEKCFDYLPPSEVLDCHRLFGDYQVTLKKREVKEKYIISSIQLKNMVSNSWREVTHFWYMGWPEKGVPSEANSIIAFLIEARSFMKTVTIDKKIIRNGDMNGNAEVNPVVVHCSPGTGRTGAVITCDIAIRDFEQTRQVDIPKIVYKIRRDRAGAVQTKEQYSFIYKVIDLYATKLAGGNLESI